MDIRARNLMNNVVDGTGDKICGEIVTKTRAKNLQMPVPVFESLNNSSMKKNLRSSAKVIKNKDLSKNNKIVSSKKVLKSMKKVKKETKVQEETNKMKLQKIKNKLITKNSTLKKEDEHLQQGRFVKNKKKSDHNENVNLLNKKKNVKLKRSLSSLVEEKKPKKKSSLLIERNKVKKLEQSTISTKVVNNSTNAKNVLNKKDKTLKKKRGCSSLKSETSNNKQNSFEVSKIVGNRCVQKDSNVTSKRKKLSNLDLSISKNKIKNTSLEKRLLQKSIIKVKNKPSVNIFKNKSRVKSLQVSDYNTSTIPKSSEISQYKDCLFNSKLCNVKIILNDIKKNNSSQIGKRGKTAKSNSVKHTPNVNRKIFPLRRKSVDNSNILQSQLEGSLNEKTETIRRMSVELADIDNISRNKDSDKEYFSSNDIEKIKTDYSAATDSNIHASNNFKIEDRTIKAAYSSIVKNVKCNSFTLTNHTCTELQQIKRSCLERLKSNENLEHNLEISKKICTEDDNLVVNDDEKEKKCKGKNKQKEDNVNVCLNKEDFKLQNKIVANKDDKIKLIRKDKQNKDCDVNVCVDKVYHKLQSKPVAKNNDKEKKFKRKNKQNEDINVISCLDKVDNKLQSKIVANNNKKENKSKRKDKQNKDNNVISCLDKVVKLESKPVPKNNDKEKKFKRKNKQNEDNNIISCLDKEDDKLQSKVVANNIKEENKSKRKDKVVKLESKPHPKNNKIENKFKRKDKQNEDNNVIACLDKEDDKLQSKPDAKNNKKENKFKRKDKQNKDKNVISCLDKEVDKLQSILVANNNKKENISKIKDKQNEVNVSACSDEEDCEHQSELVENVKKEKKSKRKDKQNEDSDVNACNKEDDKHQSKLVENTDKALQEAVVEFEKSKLVEKENDENSNGANESKGNTKHTSEQDITKEKCLASTLSENDGKKCHASTLGKNVGEKCLASPTTLRNNDSEKGLASSTISIQNDNKLGSQTQDNSAKGLYFRSTNRRISLKAAKSNNCCRHWFVSDKAYIEHLSSELTPVHLEKLREMSLIQCTVCKKFIASDVLLKHMNKVHEIHKMDDKKMNDIMSKYEKELFLKQCSLCNQWIARKALSSHLKKNHKLNASDSKDFLIKELPESVKKYVCCGKTFWEVKAYTKHCSTNLLIPDHQEHLEKRALFQCIMCKNSYNRKYLFEHLHKVHHIIEDEKQEIFAKCLSGGCSDNVISSDCVDKVSITNCILCKKSYTKKYLLEHIKIKHDLNDDQREKILSKCINVNDAENLEIEDGFCHSDDIAELNFECIPEEPAELNLECIPEEPFMSCDSPFHTEIDEQFEDDQESTLSVASGEDSDDDDEPKTLKCFLSEDKSICVSSVLDLPFSLKPIVLVEKLNLELMLGEEHNKIIPQIVMVESLFNHNHEILDNSENNMPLILNVRGGVTKMSPHPSDESILEQLSHVPSKNNATEKTTTKNIKGVSNNKRRRKNFQLLDGYYLQDSSDDSFSSSDTEAGNSEGELDEKDAINEKCDEKDVPIVELDLFTLDSAADDSQVLLTDPSNPDFKVLASTDAIFVGDSHLEDKEEQEGFVTDANSVVYIKPDHFLFPDLDGKDFEKLSDSEKENIMQLSKTSPGKIKLRDGTILSPERISFKLSNEVESSTPGKIKLKDGRILSPEKISFKLYNDVESCKTPSVKKKKVISSPVGTINKTPFPVKKSNNSEKLQPLENSTEKSPMNDMELQSKKQNNIIEKDETDISTGVSIDSTEKTKVDDREHSIETIEEKLCEKKSKNKFVVPVKKKKQKSLPIVEDKEKKSTLTIEGMDDIEEFLIDSDAISISKSPPKNQIINSVSIKSAVPRLTKPERSVLNESANEQEPKEMEVIVIGEPEPPTPIVIKIGKPRPSNIIQDPTYLRGNIRIKIHPPNTQINMPYYCKKSAEKIFLPDIPNSYITFSDNNNICKTPFRVDQSQTKRAKKEPKIKPVKEPKKRGRKKKVSEPVLDQVAEAVKSILDPTNYEFENYDTNLEEATLIDVLNINTIDGVIDLPIDGCSLYNVGVVPSACSEVVIPGGSVLMNEVIPDDFATIDETISRNLPTNKLISDISIPTEEVIPGTLIHIEESIPGTLIPIEETIPATELVTDELVSSSYIPPKPPSNIDSTQLDIIKDVRIVESSENVKSLEDEVLDKNDIAFLDENGILQSGKGNVIDASIDNVSNNLNMAITVDNKVGTKTQSNKGSTEMEFNASIDVDENTLINMIESYAGALSKTPKSPDIGIPLQPVPEEFSAIIEGKSIWDTQMIFSPRKSSPIQNKKADCDLSSIPLSHIPDLLSPAKSWRKSTDDFMSKSLVALSPSLLTDILKSPKRTPISKPGECQNDLLDKYTPIKDIHEKEKLSIEYDLIQKTDSFVPIKDKLQKNISSIQDQGESSPLKNAIEILNPRIKDLEINRTPPKRILTYIPEHSSPNLKILKTPPNLKMPYKTTPKSANDGISGKKIDSKSKPKSNLMASKSNANFKPKLKKKSVERMKKISKKLKLESKHVYTSSLFSKDSSSEDFSGFDDFEERKLFPKREQKPMTVVSPHNPLKMKISFANDEPFSEDHHKGVGNYACPYCKQHMGSKCRMEEHQRTHTNEKPYPCPYVPCEHRSRRLDNLVCHIKRLHKHEVNQLPIIPDYETRDALAFKQWPILLPGGETTSITSSISAKKMRKKKKISNDSLIVSPENSFFETKAEHLSDISSKSLVLKTFLNDGESISPKKKSSSKKKFDNLYSPNESSIGPLNKKHCVEKNRVGALDILPDMSEPSIATTTSVPGRITLKPLNELLQNSSRVEQENNGEESASVSSNEVKDYFTSYFTPQVKKSEKPSRSIMKPNAIFKSARRKNKTKSPTIKNQLIYFKTPPDNESHENKSELPVSEIPPTRLIFPIFNNHSSHGETTTSQNIYNNEDVYSHNYCYESNFSKSVNSSFTLSSQSSIHLDHNIPVKNAQSHSPNSINKNIKESIYKKRKSPLKRKYKDKVLSSFKNADIRTFFQPVENMKIKTTNEFTHTDSELIEVPKDFEGFEEISVNSSKISQTLHTFVDVLTMQNLFSSTSDIPKDYCYSWNEEKLTKSLGL